MLNIVSSMLDLSHAMGYGGVFMLMTIESSFIPFPSEVIILPAAYLAQQGELNIILVVVFGILGSLLGATINYVLALKLGRIMVYKLAEKKQARYFLITKDKLARAERFFLRYGNSSTFIGRLVPAIRQLISIPAGFSKMKFRNFIFFTFLGSSVWVIILAYLGYAFGANKELLARYYKEISIFFIVVAVVFVIYLIFKKRQNNTKQQANKQQNS